MIIFRIKVTSLFPGCAIRHTSQPASSSTPQRLNEEAITHTYTLDRATTHGDKNNIAYQLLLHTSF